ncbi:MAG: PIN domain-containing protein [Candidatus Nanopelagicales bacterium]|nr:PIN domain-containing protein [Candidatus Nanopelagicales bacterium]MDZ4249264.1 PIN domain-containing protein [Candidatus Nanopelagicales bacterium]MDZ7577646.1 PIN domain-containing protein [Candidatus Nanopelagicales bacterium]
MSAVVLDAEALSRLVNGGRHERTVRAALEAAYNTNANAAVPAAVLAELYRGGRRDQALDSFLSRDSSLDVTPTDRGLARTIGNVLAAVGRGSSHHVDASVAAVAIKNGGGVVITADADDLSVLCAGFPGILIQRI